MTEEKKEILERSSNDVEPKAQVTILEDNSTDLVTAGESVLDFLDEQADEFYTPRLISFKNVSKTGMFVAEGFGKDDTMLGVILKVETTRALWPFGTKAEQDEMEEWTSPLPICSSRNNNGVKGEMVKTLDNDVPDIIRQMVAMPIVGSDGICKRCHWNEFGSGGDRGKQCKEGRRFMIWSPSSGGCAVLAISPSSIRNWEEYRAAIPAGHFSRIVTKFTTNEIKRGAWTYFEILFEAARDGKGEIEETPMNEIATLGKTVTYDGVKMREIKALSLAFSGLDFDQDLDYPNNGSGDSSDSADSDVSSDGDDIDDF